MSEELLPNVPDSAADPGAERILRAALAGHAPRMVNTEDAWLAVRSRLPLDAGLARSVEGAAQSTVRPWLRPALARRALLTAGIAAVLIALVGAGVGAAYWGGLVGGPKAQLIGDAGLYTAIRQSKTIGGVTVSVDQAYADPGNTFIAVTLSVPESQAQRYGTVILNQVSIRDAAGHETDGLNIMCEPLARADLLKGGGIEHCMLDAGPLPVPADAGSIPVTVEVGETWLFSRNGGQRTVLPGPWTYQFSLLWHSKSLGSGGPYAQPAR
jgi:hypothetical protein